MCPDRQILSVFADGELSSPWKEKLEAHVASCPACREVLESWKGFFAPGEADETAAKERVWESLSRRIAGADHAKDFREIVPAAGFWRRSVTLPFPAVAALGAAAAAAFVLTLTSLWFRAPAVPAAPDAAVVATSGISGIDTEMINISPLNDMSQVLQYLSSTDSNDIVIIRLPESRSFQSAGEPQIIKAADYSQRRLQQ